MGVRVIQSLRLPQVSREETPNENVVAGQGAVLGGRSIPLERRRPQGAPPSMGRLQSAAQRRLRQDEQRRQQLAERARVQELEAKRAKETRERADEERQKVAQEGLQKLREKWKEAGKKVTDVKAQVQQAASERIALWRKRLEAGAAARQQAQDVLDRLRLQLEDDTGPTSGASEIEGTLAEHRPKKAAIPRPKTAAAWLQSTPRIMPRPVQPPNELLLPTRTQASCARAQYDSEENDAVVLRQLAKVQMALELKAKLARMKAKREEGARVIRRHFRRRGLLRGWRILHEIWAEAVFERDTREHLARASRLLQKYIRRNALSFRWAAWVEFVASGGKATVRANLMLRVLRALKHRHLRRGLLGWHAICIEQNRQREAMRGCLTRLMKRGLSRCWEAWKEMAEEMRHTKDAMGFVLRALINRQLRRGLLGWHEAYVEQNRQREAMRGCLTRLMKRGLSRCWEAWKEMAEEMRHTKDAMGFVLRALINRHLKRGLLGWHETYVEQVHKSEMMRHFVTRLLNRHVARGWNHWREVWLAMRRLRAIGSRVLNRELSASWNAWRGLVEERAHLLDVMDFVLRAFTNRLLKQGFLGWHDAACELQLRHETMRFVASLMLNRHLGRGFRTWCDVTLAITEARYKELRAWERERERAQERAAHRELLEKKRAAKLVEQLLLAQLNEQRCDLVESKTVADAKANLARINKFEEMVAEARRPHSPTGSGTPTRAGLVARVAELTARRAREVALLGADVERM